MPLVLVKVNAYNSRKSGSLSSSSLELFISKHWKGRGRIRLKDSRFLQNLPCGSFPIVIFFWDWKKIRFSFLWYARVFKTTAFPSSSLSLPFPLPSLHSKSTVNYGFKNAQPNFQSYTQSMVCFAPIGYLGNWVTNVETVRSGASRLWGTQKLGCPHKSCLSNTCSVYSRKHSLWYHPIIKITVVSYSHRAGQRPLGRKHYRSLLGNSFSEGASGAVQLAPWGHPLAMAGQKDGTVGNSRRSLGALARG